ncbi:unnamed protein product, partial [Closterium sp. Yama58-4]
NLPDKNHSTVVKAFVFSECHSLTASSLFLFLAKLWHAGLINSGDMLRCLHVLACSARCKNEMCMGLRNE